MKKRPELSDVLPEAANMDPAVREATLAVIRILHPLEPKQAGEVIARVAASWARVSAPDVEEAQVFAHFLEDAIINAWKTMGMA